MAYNVNQVQITKIMTRTKWERAKKIRGPTKQVTDWTKHQVKRWQANPGTNSTKGQLNGDQNHRGKQSHCGPIALRTICTLDRLDVGPIALWTNCTLDRSHCEPIEQGTNRTNNQSINGLTKRRINGIDNHSIEKAFLRQRWLIKWRNSCLEDRVKRGPIKQISKGIPIVDIIETQQRIDKAENQFNRMEKE